MNTTEELLMPVHKLSQDLRKAAATLGQTEARFLVDAYYMMQEQRIRAAHQLRSLSQNEEPHEVLGWFEANSSTLEKQVARALESYAEANPVGQWAMSITGIGPVIAAGLLANIDIEKAPTAGHIWRFAGLDPTQKWEKKTKRPWNASLKTLCWKIGESFVKVSGLESDVYGKVWLERKELEENRNEAGQFKAVAEAELSSKKYDKKTDAYKAYIQGRLPQGRIHARAKRYAVKLFLSHLHWVMYEIKYGTPPPKPYVLEHLGHVHLLKPPNWK